jgi:CO/xanthine dehydrogenase Mo-binding subunit
VSVDRPSQPPQPPQPPQPSQPSPQPSPIGRSVRRSDGVAKVTGRAVFGIDREEPRMLHGRILRSPVPAGRIVRLDTTKAAALPGVRAIITGAATSARVGWVVFDQTLMAIDRVRFIGEPIAAVAADTVAQAAAAVRAIELEIEPLPAATDLTAATAPDAPLVHPEWETYATLLPGHRDGNLAWETTVDRGDVDGAFARDDVTVVEDSYVVPRQHQAYLEPRCAVARWEAGRCTIHSSTQATYKARDAVAAFLGVRAAQVRIVMTTVGGGFGGKVDAHLEPFAALLSREAGRPVKLVNTRRDEFLVGSPRENATVRIRSAVLRDGEIVARAAEVVMDAGAYSGESPFLASVPAHTIVSNYRVGAIRLRTAVTYTNTAPTGAYRGVGGPYLIFALERHMDHIARELGLDRRELRRRTCFVAGDLSATGQRFDDVAFHEGLDRVEAIAPWAEAGAGPLRGKGIACVSWLTNPMPAAVTLKLEDDGTVILHSAGGESGSGSLATAVAQIVAAELGIPFESVIVAEPDTDTSGYDAGPQGSRTTHIVGRAAALAATDVREQVLRTAAGLLEIAPADLELVDGQVRAIGSPERSVPLGTVAQTALWTTGPIHGKGSYIAPPIEHDEGCATGHALATLNGATFHVHQAEVEIDPDTGKVTVTRYVIAQDVGRAINPQQIEGQIHGGVLQGIGYALYEQLRLEDGAYSDLSFESYRLPTAFEAPPIEIALMEHPDPNGPYGAKGIAEPPILPVAAVVANAIADAVGVQFDRLPITPFDVLAALRNRKPEES